MTTTTQPITANFPASEQVISNSGDYFDQLHQAIEHSKHTIDLETYIFNNDVIGRQIAESLKVAAERGVKIRILVDGAGSPQWGARMAKRLERAGIQTKVFHPFPWQIWNWSRSVTRIPWLMRWLYLMLKANSRNHRKVCIIDGDIAFVGSFNITKAHLPHSQGGDGWHDIALCLKHCNLERLQAAFNRAWNLKTLQDRLRDAFRYVKRNPQFRLNDTRHRRRVLYKNLLHIMSRCRQRIWITNAYFVPDTRLLGTLKEMASLGVDVRILLPHKNNHFFISWASAAFYQSLLKAGVRIFEYLPSMLHAKTLILDDWMLIGSSNLNHRSLLHDLEVDVNVRSDAAKHKLEQTFLADLQQSQELSLATWNKRPMLQRVFGRIALYLKYWF